MIRSTFNAVLFDLDGVLFHTEPLHRSAWIETMQTFGHTIDDEFLMPWTGIPCIDLAAHFEANLSPRRDKMLYHRIKGESFRRIVRDRLAPFEAIPEMVHRLTGFARCGFVTSNDRIDADLMIQAAGYSDVFRSGVTYDDVAKHKPFPDPYLKGAALLGCEPRTCLAVEDSPSGVASAKSAGMIVCGVTTSFDAEVLGKADHIFADTRAACEWMLSDAVG